MLQDIDTRDSQYVLANEEALTRDNTVAEPTDNDFRMAQLSVEGKLGSLRLVSATSFVDQGFDYALDASDAATSFGLAGTARFEDNRAYSIFNQELRLSPAGKSRWLVGASYLRATTKGASVISGDTGASQTVETLDRRTTEYALFGEATWRLFTRIDATVGARLSRSVSRDFATRQSGQQSLRRDRTLVSPNVSLSLPLDDGQGIVYLRYARAKRPGGLAPSSENATGVYKADKLGTIDLGIRRTVAEERLSFSSSAYYTRWDRIQSDYLLPNGLVSTRNAGRASIFGFEASLDWQPGEGIRIAAGGAVQHARLTRAPDGTELDDRRVPVVPALTGRLSVAKTISLSAWHGQAAVQANYIGNARLSFDSDLDRPMGNYTDLSAHAELSRGAWTIGARLNNLLDIQGDSFAFGNPFSIRKRQQFTPVRPRTVILSVTHSF
ncbi:TonB-dependent receptor [Sphingomonas cannabina]|uniref:TonB-dependent receptor domain-containing protein n=1 Tax=Sphingomonas cannabina TaxID=2899123 RepID=UPI001F164577|nr:TonB-dependent receptor [Sphingomonas cannabina]UIJ47221.1 TonB-dependent receptor [Sphingomonas cannabina]